jgi:hypothetical protein
MATRARDQDDGNGNGGGTGTAASNNAAARQQQQHGGGASMGEGSNISSRQHRSGHYARFTKNAWIGPTPTNTTADLSCYCTPWSAKDLW